MNKTSFNCARRLLPAIFCTAFLISSLSLAHAAAKDMLVISVTKGFRHSAIEHGEKILRQLGEKTGDWNVDYARTDEDLAAKMSAEGLKKYKAVVFNNTTGDLPFDREAFLSWVRAGGGVVGIHAATDTFNLKGEGTGWWDYIDLIGGQFAGHGPQVEVECIVEDRFHPATRHLPAKFKVYDEIYLHKDFSREKVRGLITLDKQPNTKEPGDHPISWVRDYGKGRVFYTSLGHREDVWDADWYQEHVVGGIRWALGLAHGTARPKAPVTASLAERRDGFVALFNGKDLTGWKPQHDGGTPWTAQNAMLVMGKGGANLISEEKFEDFIIRYEYMVPKGGNSGLYLRGRYEIQVLDDFESGQPSAHGNGSIYGKITPSAFASKPAGEWQSVEAKLVGKQVTVVLNGVKIIDEQIIDGPTGAAIDDRVDEPGPIMLQGDHGPVAYRNIRIKRL